MESSGTSLVAKQSNFLKLASALELTKKEVKFANAWIMFMALSVICLRSNISQLSIDPNFTEQSLDFFGLSNFDHTGLSEESEPIELAGFFVD